MQQMVWLPQILDSPDDIIWNDVSKYHTLNPHKNWSKSFKTSWRGTLKISRVPKKSGEEQKVLTEV